MMHLGSRISALVDGQLDPGATERALAHVACCPTCAQELASARAARQALAAAAADPVAPTEDLTARLLALSAQLPPVAPARSTDPFAVGGGAALPTAATHALRGDVVGRRTPARLMVGSVAGLGAVAAGLFLLGERPVVTPSSHPAAVLGLLAHTSSPAATDLPADEGNVELLRDQGWTFPTALPDGWEVRAIRWVPGSPQVLEVDVTGPSGAFVVTEQQGRLDTEALAGAPVRQVGGREVHVLSVEPWQVAWQSQATVVQVVASQHQGDLDALVAAFPVGGYDDTVTGRIGRGWQTVTAAVRERP